MKKLIGMILKDEKTQEFDIRTYDNVVLHVVIGQSYSAIGTCGMTDGLLVKGKLTSIDEWGALITCNKGILHLCNKRTLNAI